MILLETFTGSQVAIYCTLTFFISFLIGGSLGWYGRGKKDGNRYEFQTVRKVYGQDFKGGDATMRKTMAARLKKQGEIIVTTPDPKKLMKQFVGELKIVEPEFISIETIHAAGPNVPHGTYKFILCKITK